MDNIPVNQQAYIDDMYSEWSHCDDCGGSWKGEKVLCDCYEVDKYNSEN